MSVCCRNKQTNKQTEEKKKYKLSKERRAGQNRTEKGKRKS
jgi:hypothetical protein